MTTGEAGSPRESAAAPALSADAGRPRLLVFVAAFNAEHTLEGLLGRLPRAFLSRWQVELLVIDDASADGTFDVGLSVAEAWEGCPMTVLRNPTVQGYGGNLKLGFEYAIHHGFDAVAILHADGKYAPEKLPDMLAPVAEGEADAVVGSRFLEADRREIRRIPLHKRLGNRFLTRLQNRLTGARLSDWPSAYRVYAVDALRRIPFQRNTDRIDFDAEILMQLLRGGFRIREVPVPTYHGEEFGHRRGLAYAGASLSTALASILHGLGLRYRRSFDVDGGPPRYSAKLGYRSSHTLAIDAVPPGSRVLDVGCGPGVVSRELCARGCRVVGLDRRPPAAGSVSRFVPWQLENVALPEEPSDHDVVLLLDVLEHLPDPEGLLDELRRRAELGGPLLILTVPNVAFLPLRLMLLMGQFNYGKEGILDFTHTRLFTFASMKRTLQQCGYRVLEVQGIPAPYPKAIGSNALSRGLLRANALLIRLLPSVFSYQMFVRARPLPTARHLLDETLRQSAWRRAQAAGVAGHPRRSDRPRDADGPEV